MTIYFRPDKKRYSTGIDISEEDWKKINGKRLKDEDLKETRIAINAVVNKAEAILGKLIPFSFPAFEKAYFKNGSTKINLTIDFWFHQYIDELSNQDRIGTKSSYNTTLNSLKKYKGSIKLTDITKEFLEGYELFMKQNNKSLSTVGIYLRQLRTIINRAITQGILPADSYPFKLYKIPGSRNIKKALSDEELQTLLSYIPKLKEETEAFDFWVFSYLCNGMNFTDIAHLKKDNVSGSFLFFIRQKTRRTKKKDLRPIKVVLHERAKEIIQKRRNLSVANPYLFPILDEGLSAVTQRNRIQKFIKNVNRQMDIIRSELKIEQKLGTYVARHSFSTRLMRKGASTQLIKESLGHSSVATTENYLGDFADTVKSEYSAMLTDFN